MDGLDLKSTPFASEIQRMMSQGTKAGCTCFELTIFTKDDSFKPLLIVGFHKVSDYIANFYDELSFELKVTQYQKEQMIESRSSLEIHVKEFSHPANSAYSLLNLKLKSDRRYKARLYLEGSDTVSQNNLAVNNQTYIKDKTLVGVKVQIIEKGLEELKSRYVGGGFPANMPMDIIKYLIDFNVNKDNDDVNTLINGCEVAPSFVTDKKQFVIPHGTPLLKAIDIINRDSGGIYPCGFSYYIQHNLFYLFPSFSLTRFSESVKKLIIVNLPKNRLPGLDNSFADDRDSCLILSTRDSGVYDRRESRKITDGTGVRFTDLNKLISDMGQAINNKLMVNSSKVVNDITPFERSKDEISQIKFPENPITNGKNIELSKLAPSNGFVLRLSWESSDHSIVYPGMPVKVLYMSKNKAVSAVGIVHGIETVYYPYEKTPDPKKYACLSYINVFVSEENV